MIYSKPNSDYEHELVQQIAVGNRVAFQNLYVLYKDKVYNTAIGYLQNAEDAEEVAQDVFVSLFKNANSFKGNAKVGTWIYKITVNKALTQISKNKRKPTNDEALKDHHQIDFKHPGIALEQQEKAAYLFRAIHTLIDSQKTAFILSYVEALPQQEVANIMEISVKAVESLLQRAKSNLKQKLIHLYPEGN